MVLLSPELVRIHAHLCGDGHITMYKTSEKDRVNRAAVVYTNKNPDLLQEFQLDMNKVFGVKMSRGPKHEVIVKSIRIANFLLSLSKYKSKEWRIPKIIKNSSKFLKLEWIVAFSKDEGYLPPDRKCIRIKSMNLYGLKDLKEILDSLCIYSNLTGQNCDNSYYINIKKMKELENFSKLKIR